MKAWSMGAVYADCTIKTKKMRTDVITGALYIIVAILK